MKYPNWTRGQTEALLNKLGGEERAKLFLSGQLVVVPIERVLKPSIIRIDRANPFNPAKFIGDGCSIWRGPKDGDGLDGAEEQDKRSLAITELDPAKLFLQTGLDEEETTVTGEVKRARLLLRAIQADAKIGQWLYVEKGQATLRWLHETLKVTWIEFLGTTLRDPRGSRIAMYLRKRGDGSWDWGFDWLGTHRNIGCPALGVESNPPA